MSRYSGNQERCPGCGIRYKDFRTYQPLTYHEVWLMLWVPGEDSVGWKYKRRNTVLGKWHQIKQEDWRRHIAECEGPPSDEVPFRKPHLFLVWEGRCEPYDIGCDRDTSLVPQSLSSGVSSMVHGETMTIWADLLVLDGRHLLWRVMDAFRTLSTEVDGETIPVGGVYGFLVVALRVHARYGGKTVVAWEGRHNFRLDLFPSYKGRDKPPDPERLEIISEMSHQERLLISLLQSMGVRQYRGVGCEADDVIGRLVGIGTRCKAITIVYSGDSDLRQLINDRSFTVSPGKRSDTLYNSEAVKEKHGVPPNLIAALKALAGDSSDHIPGLPGIGPKTAAILLAHYGSLIEVFRAAQNEAEDWPVANRFVDVVKSHGHELKLYFELTKIRTTMAVESVPAKRRQRDVVRQLQALKFRSLAAPAELRGLMRMGG